jgi:hypothetical protein
LIEVVRGLVFIEKLIGNIPIGVAHLWWITNQLQWVTVEASFLKVPYFVAEFTSFCAISGHWCRSHVVDRFRVSVGEHCMAKELLTIGGKLFLQDFLHSDEVRLSRSKSLPVKREDVLEGLRSLTVVAILRAHRHVLQNWPVHIPP